MNLTAAADSGAPDVLTSADLEKQIRHLLGEGGGEEGALLERLALQLRRGGLSLPSMPEAVIRVQEMIDSLECSIADLAVELERDPALATRIVGIANSPFYAGLDTAGSVRDAVVRIGLGETRNIVMAIMLRARVFRVQGFENEVRDLWRHSLAVSRAAQLVAAEVGTDPDPAFLAGLIHDVGRVVLFSMAGDILRESRGARSVGAEEIQQVSDLVHASLGEVIAEAWQVSSEIATAIGNHHDPDEAPEGSRRLAGVLAAADILARRALDPAAEDRPADEDWEQAASRIGLDPEGSDALEEEIAEALGALDKVI